MYFGNSFFFFILEKKISWNVIEFFIEDLVYKSLCSCFIDRRRYLYYYGCFQRNSKKIIKRFYNMKCMIFYELSKIDNFIVIYN